MDSIWVSEAYDLGSIPSKATKKTFTSNSLGHLFSLFTTLE